MGFSLPYQLVSLPDFERTINSMVLPNKYTHPGTQMTSIFEGTQPTKTRPKLQSKQGAPFRFQDYLYKDVVSWGLSIRDPPHPARDPPSHHDPHRGPAPSWNRTSSLDALRNHRGGAISPVVSGLGFFGESGW